MKILLYSVFWPSIGGVETVADTLARNIIRMGHECVVVTETPAEQEDRFGYKVVRRPPWIARYKLVRECSLVHSNGASVAMYPFAMLAGKPFVWTHNGYQVSYLDGLGWNHDGTPAPLTISNFVRFHFQRGGVVAPIAESFKYLVRRFIADRVDLNIACSQWVADRQRLKNQEVAYNPYPLEEFKAARSISGEASGPRYDFIFVGRLVSEKGVDSLIRAFHLLVADPKWKNRSLVIIGDGPLRGDLEHLVIDLGIRENVSFLGLMRGKKLVDIVARARIGVVPSLYEEPSGGVILELMAAGKNIIVSEKGGHAECVGSAGLKFPNGSYKALHECMVTLLSNDSLARSQLELAASRIDLFSEERLTRRYLELYERAIEKHMHR